MSFLVFMNSTPGRWIRATVGSSLIVLGLVLGGWALVLVAFGALMLTTGVLHVCPIGPLVGRSLDGASFCEPAK